MNEGQFQQQAQRIQGLIRGQKVQQLQADLSKERAITQARWIYAAVAQEGVTAAKVDLQIAQQKTQQKRVKLQTEGKETQILMQGLEEKRDQLQFAQTARTLKNNILGQKLQALNLSLAEASNENSNRRASAQGAWNTVQTTAVSLGR